MSTSAGKVKGSTADSVRKFLRIPFAALRFEPARDNVFVLDLTPKDEAG